MDVSGKPAPATVSAEKGASGSLEPATEKQRKKERKLAEDAQRPLDARERYRALVDALDEGHQLLEIADRKARFALVIMGALNVLAFLLATRTELVGFVPPRWRSWLAYYLVVYAATAVYFFLQAIEALRPRRFHPNLEFPGAAGPEHYPLGLRYYEDVVTRDLEAHRRAWREVRFGQLNAELAVQTHIIARTNQDKYAALRRLYAGLRVMTLLAAGLITLLAFTALAAAEDSAGSGKKGKKAEAANAALGEPELVKAGAREPSGIAFDARTGHLFLVGDEGRLVELDGEGKVLARHVVPGDIEDVAVHSPSGLVILLSERKGTLIVFDRAKGQAQREIRLDTQALLGTEPADRNQGFEGLAFREEKGRAEGGIFYLVHQRSPAMVLSVAFDPVRGNDVVGRDAVLARWPLEKRGDLTAATWVEALKRLLVIEDARDRLILLREDGRVDAEVALPGVQQEGLCLDASGTLWVADDRAGLLRFRGALDVLRSALASRGGA